MKNGMKGKPSPMTKLIEGNLDEAETTKLSELVKTMAGTKAPAGDQAAYEKKVNELIASLEVVVKGDRSAEAIDRLKTARNCKACHKEHQPD